MSKKALVTGGAGFIGSNLCGYLLDNDWVVTSFDDESTGNAANVAEYLSNPNFSHIKADVTNKESVDSAIKGVDAVFHMAANVGVHQTLQNPMRTFDVNILGTHNVLEAATREKATVLVASSSEVYGNRTDTPFRESDGLTLGPLHIKRWWYALSKAADEAWAHAYAAEKGLDIRVVRLFNTTGPKQTGRYGMVVPRLISAALKGEPLTVFGDGTQRRAFVWVGDIVKALTDFVVAQRDVARGEVLNLGTTSDISILELAKAILEKTGSNSEIKFIPYDEAYGPNYVDTEVRVPDLLKAQKLIGYRPTKDLDGILDTLIENAKKTSS